MYVKHNGWYIVGTQVDAHRALTINWLSRKVPCQGTKIPQAVQWGQRKKKRKNCWEDTQWTTTRMSSNDGDTGEMPQCPADACSLRHFSAVLKIPETKYNSQQQKRKIWSSITTWWGLMSSWACDMHCWLKASLWTPNPDLTDQTSDQNQAEAWGSPLLSHSDLEASVPDFLVVRCIPSESPWTALTTPLNRELHFILHLSQSEMFDAICWIHGIKMKSKQQQQTTKYCCNKFLKDLTGETHHANGRKYSG